MKKITTSLLALIISASCFAQKITEEEELRGSITSERAWWDLVHYDLKVEVLPNKKALKGSNTITYKVLDRDKVMQIELQPPMRIDRVEQNGEKLSYKTEGISHFIKLKEKQKPGDENKLTVFFSGKPVEAKNPPWDGGFTWKKDSNGKHFIANSNQGIGSSIWWPNKDHPADEPDNGVTISVTTPKDLMDVSNGRLVETKDNGDTKTWVWNVVNPINNYSVNINVGDYVHFGEVYEGLNGNLDMDYYVLRENEEKAKEQFLQAPLMMRAFEYWFGPYPFYEDSYKLVEAPYLGMEHQSSVTYGNHYENGYLGRDLSESGWGLQFDFIIIHESGHEWFANNITNKDVADMWIHEGFTAYSENLYLNYHFSDEAASEYVLGTRKLVSNDRPIIGTYNANREGSGDMYYKGANILHTVRQLIHDDSKWRAILKGLNKEFYHQTVTTEQVENYISEQSGIDLSVFWDQYLRTILIPKVVYTVEGNTLKFKYEDVIEDFTMPVIAIVNGKEVWITPSSEWNTKEFPNSIKTVSFKEDFYVETEEVSK
ncbi:M1 family metallopeptidase [Ulvibacter litoralis]|uniref:Peptidase family M1 n=1 Tax=Ulvibacter litoralis TaxID=227084 RepID=A0A1G7F157_9FLAO|nr:M1 family metallopeptidase [Ulvibacter litoralis]GHC53074.1 peptidase M1 [Ulvibacter litoralis]SDE69690.1 Peptidase family M1 [Ulvibacter litoralis]